VNKTVALAVALIAGLFAIVAPILFAIDFAKHQSLNAEMDRAVSYARDVLRRSDRISDQIRSGIGRLIAARADDPCADANIDLMRQITLESPSVQVIGFVVDDGFVCSSLGRHAPPIPLGPVELVTSTGSAVRTGVELPMVPGTVFTVIERNGYAAVINKALPIDASIVEEDVSLATYTPDDRKIRSARGFIKPAWIETLGERSEAAFFDGEYVVAVLRSARYATGAIAALPVRYLDQRVHAFTLMLVPLGILAGIVLSLAVFYLARLQMSFPVMLKAALKRGEIFLAYQPVVELATGRWVGAEALIRWRRANGEVMRPDLFIPAAEDSGLSQRITERVIGIVAHDLPAILRASREFHIGINLTSADLQARHTVDLLRRLFHEAGAGPHNLLVEATERGFLNTEVAKDVIQEIRSIGIRVAIDDFGTGYSSLAYLQAFKIDCLKIDKSFVDTLGTEAATSHVVLHIIEMAKALNLEMIAEGVETETQARLLRELGVRYAQGYLFGRPMALEDLVGGLSGADGEAVRQFHSTPQ
jgi:sensor c-di-GMP phosphodiesterase-like protein